jgi:3-oxoacyl-[acyl-carrier-protein] synthase II
MNGCKSTRERLAITGMGAVTGFGHGVPALWAGLSTGTSAIRRYDLFSSKDFPIAIAAQAPGEWDGKSHRALGFARRALEEALTQAALPTPTRTGLCGAIGGFPGTSESTTVDPIFTGDLETLAVETTLTGPVVSSYSACAASTQALGDAARLLRRGEADAVAVVGADTRLHPLALLGYHQLGALSPHHTEAPHKASRPFDRDRAGFVIGEGAGALILETESRARQRGVPIRGFLRGAASTCDAYRLTDPEPEGTAAARCLQLALERAGLEPGDIGYASLHGTGTPANDRVEVTVLRAVFGNTLAHLPCGSFKSLIGHLSMAAGAVEIIGTLLALANGFLPANRNLDHVADDCVGPDWIRTEARTAHPRFALKTSFGFGGQNSAVVLEKGESI